MYINIYTHTQRQDWVTVLYSKIDRTLKINYNGKIKIIKKMFLNKIPGKVSDWLIYSHVFVQSLSLVNKVI